jgi:hypothetical protein
MPMPIDLGGLDQALDLLCGQVLAGAQLGIRPAPRRLASRRFT